MAATNFTPISLYYSATASATPSAGNLVAGELALNTNDGKLFYKDSSGVVQTLASKATTSGTFTSITDSGLTSGRVTYATTGGLLTDSVNLTYDGTNLMIGGTTTASATGYTFVNALGSNGGSFEVYSGTTRQAQFFCDSGSAYIGSVASIPLIFKTANAEKMRITSAGDVGIGISSPGGRLDIAGVGRLRIDTSNDYVYQTIINASGAAYKRSIVDALQHEFYVSGSEKMRIDSSGNVGIGTSSPSASAILDAQSTTKGVRMPNMTTTQKNAISSPAAGLMVFDTTLAKLCVYTGSAWQTITSI